MRGLKKLLYNGFQQNELFFDLIQGYAVQGYLFWVKGKPDIILLDAKLAVKFDCDELIVVDSEQLQSSHNAMLKKITKSIENTIATENTDPSIIKIELDETSQNTEIYYSVFKNTTTQDVCILVAIKSIASHQNPRAIDEISNILDLAVWQWNLITNELIINEKWANILGYTQEELTPLSTKLFESLIHTDDVESTFSSINEFISRKSKDFVYEFRLRHKSGDWIWVLGKGKTTSRNSNGEVEWMVGSYIDITQRKQKEQEAEALGLVPEKTFNSVLITDSQGYLIYVNKGFEELSGYSFQEIVGKKPGDFLRGPETKEADKIAFSRNLGSKKPFRQEILNYNKNGNSYYVSAFVNPIFDDNNNVIKYISIQTDITEKKRNEQFLATFKNTLDQTEDSVFIFDENTLQFTYVNQGAIDMMGYLEHELLNLHPYDIKPDFPEVEFRNLIAPLLNGEMNSYRFKTVHRLKNGTDIPVEVFLQFIYNENVKPHFVAIVKDITDQIATETELKRLSLVAENTNDLVVITDANGRMEYVNPAFESKTGYQLSELIGKKPGTVLHGPETNPVHIKANRAGLKTLKPFTQEILNYTKSGEKYWVSITFNPIFNCDNELTNFIAIEHEITEKKLQESKLQESEERLQFVLKGGELGYWDWQLDSGKLTVNDRWYEILGYSRQDFDPTLEKFYSLVHPDDLKELNERVAGAFPYPDKGDFSMEVRARHKKGHYIWILDKGSVMETDKLGSPTRISGTHLEISNRKALEFELEEERNFLKHIISVNALALVIINKSGDITFSNKGAENILGLEKSKTEQLKFDDPVWQHITIDDEPYPQDKLPFVQVLNNKSAVHDIQHGIVWEDGTRKYISVTGAPFNYINGEIEDVVFAVIDITERVTAQKQLDQTKNQMQSILKDMADVVWSINLPDYRIIYVTPSIAKVTGFSQSYYLNNTTGDTWEDRIFAQDRHLLDAAYLDLELNGCFEMECRILTKDNELKWVQNKGTIIYKNGNPERLDGYIADISERKKQEDKLKKYLEIVEDQNDRLKNFTYIVSHNLRSHSANIQGLMYLINKKNPEIAKNEYIKLLNKSSDKLEDTLQHLNSVVSVVSSTEQMTSVNLSEVVTELLGTFENLLFESKVIVKNEVPKHAHVEAVPAFLESIITNLLTNAVKYRDPNKDGCRLGISCRNINGIIIIEFEDNGLGIDLKKNGDKIFGLYKTFHNHKDARGLGLFLTKNQVESMGGKIEIKSEVGIGTTFKILLKDGNI